MNPDGTPIQAAPAAAPVTPATPAQPAEPILQQGTPHPGDLVIPGQVAQPSHDAAANAAAAQARFDAAGVQPVVSPEAASVAGRAATQNARELAASLGLAEAARFENDQQFMAALVQQAQAGMQAQAALQAHQAQAQAQAAYQAQAQAQAAAADQTRRNAIWNPPEYNPVWEQMVSRDATTGQIVPLPGVPADVAMKVQAYYAYKKGFAEKLTSDPEALLGPLIDQRAELKAAEIVRTELARQQEQSYVSNFVETNKRWLHQVGPDGHPVTNPQTGQPILSAAGKRFKAHVEEAAAAGITDIRRQEHYARTALQNDILRAQYAQGQQAAGAHTAVLEANRRPIQGGMVPQAAGPTYPQQQGLSLAQQMAVAMQAGGFTDATIDANLG